MLSDFFDETVYQLDLFKKKDRNAQDFKMMNLVDQINQSNLGPVSFLAQGIKKEWSMKRELQSPRYTTNLRVSWLCIEEIVILFSSTILF